MTSISKRMACILNIAFLGRLQSLELFPLEAALQRILSFGGVPVERVLVLHTGYETFMCIQMRAMNAGRFGSKDTGIHSTMLASPIMVQSSQVFRQLRYVLLLLQ